jgi:hypothetical protein
MSEADSDALRDGKMQEFDIRIAKSAQSILMELIRLRLDPPAGGGLGQAS